MEMKISPSMLASDYANLEAELKKCEFFKKNLTNKKNALTLKVV